MSSKLKSDAYNIIREVKKHPALWDIDYMYYNDRSHVSDSWKEISASLNMPENQIRSKWKNLRDTFLREMKKSNADTVQEYDGKWQYFNAMKFIRQKRDAEYDRKDSQDYCPVVVSDDSEASSDTDRVSPKRQKLTEDDFDLMFLKSLAPYLRELDNEKKLSVRSKLQEMLLNELVEQKSNKNQVIPKNKD